MIRLKPFLELRNFSGARLCAEQPQHTGMSRGSGYLSSRLPGPGCCGWYFGHSCAPLTAATALAARAKFRSGMAWTIALRDG
jgi:hypothetical protein